jgi:hypothetical protein
MPRLVGRPFVCRRPGCASLACLGATAALAIAAYLLTRRREAAGGGEHRNASVVSAPAARPEDGPVYAYLDASIAHLAPAERPVVLFTPDDDPPIGAVTVGPAQLLPRIVPHRYGAWVNVPSELDSNELGKLRAGGFPTLTDLIAFAANRGCNWINLDADGAEIAELQLHDDPPPLPERTASRREHQPAA